MSAQGVEVYDFVEMFGFETIEEVGTEQCHRHLVNERSKIIV